MKNTSQEANLSPRQNELISQVSNQLNIDLTNYRNDELMGRISSLINFQVYFVSSFILPLLILSILLISTFWIFDLNWLGKVLVLILGSVWLICFTVTIGIYRFFNRIRKDLVMIVNSICDLLVTLNLDVSNNIQFKENKSEKMILFFEGFLFSVLSPTLNETIQKKIPFLKKNIGKIIDKTLRLIFYSLKEILGNTLSKADTGIDSYDQTVSDASNHLSLQIIQIKDKSTKMVNRSVRIIRYPIGIIVIIQIILTFCSLYILSI